MRPVSNSEDGQLRRHQYKLSSSEPEILDVIRIGLADAQPRPHQPENWLIDDSPWQLISRPAPASLRLLLRSALEPGPWLFGSLTNSIPYADCVSRPLRASLALVRPKQVTWKVERSFGQNKPRAVFRISNFWYDLPITDPMYFTRIAGLGVGDHDDVAVGIPYGSRYLFTISLGEPFDGYCYKLVTAVVLVPATWETGGLGLRLV